MESPSLETCYRSSHSVALLGISGANSIKMHGVNIIEVEQFHLAFMVNLIRDFEDLC